MEKYTPHYMLSEIKSCLEAGKVRATFTALSNASALGFDFSDMIKVIGNLSQQDFYKSMTSYQDSKFWQDVYRLRTETDKIYLKLAIIDGLLIISFKEL